MKSNRFILIVNGYIERSPNLDGQEKSDLSKYACMTTMWKFCNFLKLILQNVAHDRVSKKVPVRPSALGFKTGLH